MKRTYCVWFPLSCQIYRCLLPGLLSSVVLRLRPKYDWMYETRNRCSTYNKNGTKQKNQQNIWTNKRKIIVVIFFRFFTIRDTKKLSSSLLFFPYRFRNGKNTNNTYIQLTGNASVPRCVNTIVNEKNVKRTDEMVKWKQISPFAINIPAHKSHSSAGFTHTFCATHLYNENAQTSTTQHHLSSCFAIICRGDLQLNLASFNRQRCFFSAVSLPSYRNSILMKSIEFILFSFCHCFSLVRIFEFWRLNEFFGYPSGGTKTHLFQCNILRVKQKK